MNQIFAYRGSPEDVSLLREFTKDWGAEFWSFDQCLETISSNSGKIFFLKNESENALALSFFATNLASADLVYLHTIPQYRRNGFGQELLKESIEVLKKENDVHSIFLEVRASNTAAIDLYKKASFETIGKRKQYYSDKEDALVMQWEQKN